MTIISAHQLASAHAVANLDDKGNASAINKGTDIIGASLALRAFSINDIKADKLVASENQSWKLKKNTTYFVESIVAVNPSHLNNLLLYVTGSMFSVPELMTLPTSGTVNRDGRVGFKIRTFDDVTITATTTIGEVYAQAMPTVKVTRLQDASGSSAAFSGDYV